MAPEIHIAIAPEALDDLTRLDAYLSLQDDPLAGELLDFVVEAISVLYRQPGIGRPTQDGLRELIIRRNRTGYLALYQYRREIGRVSILRIRHQREAGYTEEEI
jgi:plasmid stabilization system protein ParE